MSRMVRVPIDLGFYQSPSLPFAAQECQGLIPVVSQGEGSSSRGALFNIPGESQFAEVKVALPNRISTFRGRHEFGGLMYVIAGDGGAATLFSISELGAVTQIGTTGFINSPLNSDNNLADTAIIDDNGETMAIVIPGVASYFYDTTNGLVQITDSIFKDFEAESGGVTSVVEVDGYFLFSTNVSIFQSSLVTVNMGQTFAALAFLSPFLKQDLIRVGRARGQLFALGENTTKVFRNVATEPFAFLEVPGATIEKGITFRGGWVSFDNSFFLWGGGENETDAIWRGVGSGSVQKVSTDAIDDKLAEVRYSQSTAAAYSWNGQLVVGFDNSDASMFFNITASALKGQFVWFTDISGFTIPYLGIYGKIMTFRASGLIGEFDSSINSLVVGLTRTCIFAGRYLVGQGEHLFVDEIELLAETGVAQQVWDSPADSNPQVLLEYSKDAGRTWISKGSRSMGEYGKYNTLIRWNRLGRFNDKAIFRFTTTTNNRQAFTEMKITLEESFE